MLGLVKRGLSPTWLILAEAHDQAELDRLEVEHIAEARAKGVRLVNLSDGGGGRAGYVPTPEEREKIRQGNLGKPHPKHTEEWKNLMSAIMSGRNTNTPEHIAYLAEMKRGVPRSEETKAKISASKKGQSSPRKGAVLTEETKNRIRENRKGKAAGSEHGLFRHDISTEAIISAVASGKTKVQIAKELGVSPTFVHRRLKAMVSSISSVE